MEWLTQFIEKITAIFPRIAHIKYTDRGVCFKKGGVKELLPGIHFYWPIWTEVFVHPVVRQTQQLPAQTLVTKDGISVTVSVTIRFEIEDIISAFGRTYDFVDTIQDISQGEVATLICSKNYQEIIDSKKDENTDIDILLSRIIRRRLKPFGVSLKKAFIAEFSPCYPIRLWQLNS